MAETASKKRLERLSKYPYLQSSGDKFFVTHKWDERKFGLVEDSKIDIQDAIDKRSRGMSIGEQLERLSRGDTSVLLDGEPFYGDVTGMPATDGDVIMEGQKAAIENQKEALKSFGSLRSELESIEDEEARKKALEAYEAAYKRIEAVYPAKEKENG